VSDDDTRRRYEQAWNAEIPSEPGKDNHEMIGAIHEGTLTSLYIKGEETGIVDANINYVTAAYEKLDFFVVQDLFISSTAECADVDVEAVANLEKDRKSTKTERRIQRL